jgi:hypothetical protein
MVAWIADTLKRQRDVRFTLESGHLQCNQGCPLRAKSGLMHCNKLRRIFDYLHAIQCDGKVSVQLIATPTVALLFGLAGR